MTGMRTLVAAATVMTFASTVRCQASDGSMVVAFFNQEQASGSAETTGAIPAVHPLTPIATLPGAAAQSRRRRPASRPLASSRS